MRVESSTQKQRRAAFALAVSSKLLLVTDDCAFDRRRQLMHFTANESGILEHLLELGERVRVTARCAAQHLHAKSGCLRWRDAIGVGNKLERCRATTWSQCRVDFLEQSL